MRVTHSSDPLYMQDHTKIGHTSKDNPISLSLFNIFTSPVKIFILLLKC